VYGLYSSTDINKGNIIENEMGEVCGKQKWVKAPVGKNEEKRPLRRPVCIWDDNIKMDFQGMW
jgi:hypothetical protein